ncbi:MAG: zinc-binding dehydrogenase [Deltaproteobacteria bacterium]|nr:zinc-binding dehydrogenase [Deltaproteobacteria bacterium]
MRAAILTALQEPLTVADVVAPEPQFGQVAVQVHTSTVCGAQLGEIDGRKGPDRYLPHLLGHEGSGHVVAVGLGVTHVKVGDAVVLHWRPGRGLAVGGARYLWGERVVNAGPVTTFQETAIVAANRCTVVPPETDLETAALYGCAITTAFGAIANDAQLKPGESVLVLGVGGVGLAVLMAARVCGAGELVAVDRYAARLQLATRCGADWAVDTNHRDWRQQVAARLPAGADVVIENTGDRAMIEAAVELTSPRGRTVLVGVPLAGERIALDTFPLHFDKRLVGSCGGGTQPHDDIPRYLRLAAAGRFDPSLLITHRFPLTEINTAITLMRSGAAARCAIRMGTW